MASNSNGYGLFAALLLAPLYLVGISLWIVLLPLRFLFSPYFLAGAATGFARGLSKLMKEI
jgi:hypothetical protein